MQMMFYYFLMKIGRILVWHKKFEKRKALKREFNEELMPVT